jgi:HEAT repeat protein
MALGRLGTDRAMDALRKAASDREIVVRSAAARALRGGA